MRHAKGARLIKPERGSPDAAREWLTFEQIRGRYGMTRGGLDALVIAGEVPACSGKDLFEALYDEEGFAAAQERDLAAEAAQALGGGLPAGWGRSEECFEFLKAERIRLNVHPDTMYYDVSGCLARAAAARLGAEGSSPEEALLRRTWPGGQVWPSSDPNPRGPGTRLFEEEEP